MRHGGHGEDGCCSRSVAFATVPRPLVRQPAGLPVWYRPKRWYHPHDRGDVAQLGERGVRNAEVGSSILLVSTTPIPRPTRQKVGRFCWQVGGLMTQMERGGRFIWGNHSEFPKGCSWGTSVARMEAIIGLAFTPTSRRRVWCILTVRPGRWRLIRDYCI